MILCPRLFQIMTLQVFRENGLNRANIRKVLADSRDNVWLGTRQGVFIYDKKTSALKSFNYRIQELLKKNFPRLLFFPFMKI